MAQHLLAAADRFALSRLRAMCEQRLCDTVEVGTAATTLALAEQNNAAELKRVCLEFVARHLKQVRPWFGGGGVAGSRPAKIWERVQAWAGEKSGDPGMRSGGSNMGVFADKDCSTPGWPRSAAAPAAGANPTCKQRGVARAPFRTPDAGDGERRLQVHDHHLPPAAVGAPPGTDWMGWGLGGME